MSKTIEVDLTGDGGLMKKITREGVGVDTPPQNCLVSVNCIAKLTDGTIIESTLNRYEPFGFELGRSDWFTIIEAFDIGVSTMKLREKCILTCAPRYYATIPNNLKNSDFPKKPTLIFEIELLGWKGVDLSSEKDGGIRRCILTKSKILESPKKGAHVKVHLIGNHQGRVFEDREVVFNAGEGRNVGIVDGVEQALFKMSPGETSKLVIKPKYAFGSEGNSTFNIPPNAVVEYVVTLKECERVPYSCTLDKAESLTQAKIYKEKGNKYLKKENYKSAIKMYNQSDFYLSSCSDEEEGKQTKIAIHLNIALCQQKLNDHFKAKNACNTALSIDPKSIKGLYRRGQSYVRLSDLDKALKDFQRVLELDPQNKAAINQIAICKQNMRTFHDKEKKIYANMFSKFAAVDKQKKNIHGDEPDVLTSCDEWSEEDERKAADSAFYLIMKNLMLNEEQL